MDKQKQFKQQIEQGYTTKGAHIALGTAMLDGEAVPHTLVKAPLKSLTRHGLIAGATGTGKTKTIQLISEMLSEQGVPTLLMDLKGDLSGLAASGTSHPKINERHEKIGLPYQPQAFPLELLSLSKEPGARMRATVLEFGPVLFSKILGLNDTQTGIVAVIFKFCDDHQLPLLDLKDFKKILNFALSEGKTELEESYGRMSSSSAGSILRKVVELESQGAEEFFGEPSFDVDDLVAVDKNGRGQISIIRLIDMQNRPKLFSTFMLSLLAEVYQTFPEEGDLDKPKLVIFIDEAHLIFDNASRALLDQIETIIKLIRSKGVGIFFCTQNPKDVPDDVLSQLGMKVQHALRAFTAKDRKALKLAAENYPTSEFYKTDKLLMELGIGEAAITVLDEKGRPTPLAATLLQAPRSRMDILSPSEIDELVKHSKLSKKYNQRIDRHSAYEMLNQKIAAIAAATADSTTTKKQKAPDSTITSLSKNTLVRQLGRTVLREVTRGLLGVLGVKRR